jgi:hypothetical protein
MVEAQAEWSQNEAISGAILSARAIFQSQLA